MSNEKTKSEQIYSRRASDLLQDNLLKLRVPGTLTRLQGLVSELENQQSDMELKQDELEKANADLKLLLDQYSSLYDSSPVCCLTLNRSGTILRVNSESARLFGIERSDLINHDLQQFVSGDSLPEYPTFLESIFDNQSQEIIEFELQRNEDKIFVRIIDRHNREENLCIVTLEDVTAEKLEKLLEKKEREYRIIYENITHGIILCDKDGKVVSSNKAAKTILDLSSHQLERMLLPEILSNPILEDDKAFSGKKTLPLMKTLNSKEAMKDVTIGYIPQNSTNYTWIIVSAMSINMPDEDDVQFLISFDDITSQKNLVLYNKLTIREKQVFQMLVKGYSRKEVAVNLDITPKTVDKHRENLMEKLKMYSPDELIDYSKQL